MLLNLATLALLAPLHCTLINGCSYDFHFLKEQNIYTRLIFSMFDKFMLVSILFLYRFEDILLYLITILKLKKKKHVLLYFLF